MLRTLGDKEKTHWKDHLPLVIHAYNCTLHESTGFSPYFLLYGHHPRLPVDLLFGLVGEESAQTHTKYVETWSHRMTEAYKIASENSKHASNISKLYYDRRTRGVVLQPGDRVLVRNLSQRGGPGKLRSYWEKIIYVVKGQVANNPVYVVTPESGDQKKARTLHRNLLLLVNDLPVRTQPHSIKPVLQDQQQRQGKGQRVAKTREPLQDSDTTDSESDQSTGDYWLRIPVRERDIHGGQPSASHREFNPKYSHSAVVSRREEQMRLDETTEGQPTIQLEHDKFPGIGHSSVGDETEERVDSEREERQRDIPIDQQAPRYKTFD